MKKTIIAIFITVMAMCLSGATAKQVPGSEKANHDTKIISPSEANKHKSGDCLDRIHKQQYNMTEELNKIKDLLDNESQEEK
jgi:hypothetical protein